MSERAWLRQHLAGLSEAELLATCAAAKRGERDSLPRGHCCPVVTACWYECLRREREDIFLAALEQVRREETEHRRANRQALADLRTWKKENHDERPHEARET